MINACLGPFRGPRRYRKASTWSGRVRQWWLHRVLGNCGETCDRCGGSYDAFVWWCPDDDLWQRAYREATGHPSTESEGRDRLLYSGLLCPRCFTAAARRLGLLLVWKPEIERRREGDSWGPPETSIFNPVGAHEVVV